MRVPSRGLKINNKKFDFVVHKNNNIFYFFFLAKQIRQFEPQKFSTKLSPPQY